MEVEENKESELKEYVYDMLSSIFKRVLVSGEVDQNDVEEISKQNKE